MNEPAFYFPVARDYGLPGPGFTPGDPGAGTQRFEVDSEYGLYTGSPQQGPGLWSNPALRERLEATVCSWIATAVERDQPGLLQPGATLDAMAAGIQEDVVVMHRPPDTDAVRAIAAYVNVSFPSGWCPACVVGRSFLSLHAPVPNTGRFGGPGRRRGAALLFAGGDSIRFVWTVTPDGELDRRHCRNPGTHKPVQPDRRSSWDDPLQLHLRVERQFIAPIDATTAIFLIRVYRYPVRQLNREHQRTLVAALEHMPATVRQYKGLPENVAARVADFSRRAQRL